MGKNKNIFMKKCCLFCLVLLFSCASLGSQELQIPRFFSLNERLERPDLTRLPRLRFLTTVDFPPFNYIDNSGNLAGYHIDLVRSICLELKLEDKCQIEAVEWEQLAKRLNNGEAEAMVAGLAVSARTRADFAFSRPYMRFPARFVSSRRQDIPLKTLSDNMVAVGIVKNTVHEKMFAAYFPNSQMQIFDDYETLTQALREEEISLAFGDGMRFSQWLASQDSGECCQFIGGAYYGVDYLGQGLRLATRHHNQALIDAFDYALYVLEQKGKLTELYLRYFPIGFY